MLGLRESTLENTVAASPSLPPTSDTLAPKPHLHVVDGPERYTIADSLDEGTLGQDPPISSWLVVSLVGTFALTSAYVLGHALLNWVTL